MEDVVKYLGNQLLIFWQGMSYIHDSIVDTHGRLKSSNIYIDSRWMCKIGDISMPVFRAGEQELEGKEQNYYSK